MPAERFGVPCLFTQVNAEKLLFNWQLARDLVKKKAEERWGSGVVDIFCSFFAKFSFVFTNLKDKIWEKTFTRLVKM